MPITAAAIYARPTRNPLPDVAMSNTVSRDRILCGCYIGLFMLSGLAGLIYESVWTHYLKLFLGHAAYAQTLPSNASRYTD